MSGYLSAVVVPREDIIGRSGGDGLVPLSHDQRQGNTTRDSSGWPIINSQDEVFFNDISLFPCTIATCCERPKQWKVWKWCKYQSCVPQTKAMLNSLPWLLPHYSIAGVNSVTWDSGAHFCTVCLSLYDKSNSRGLGEIWPRRSAV